MKPSLILCSLLLSKTFVANAFGNFHIRAHSNQRVEHTDARSSTCYANIHIGTQLKGSYSKWDNLVDEDDEDYDEFEPQGPEVPKDMRYIEFNIMRQNKNWGAIRDVGGASVTNDVYVRSPNSNEFWFCGKIARISDVTVEQAVAKQYPLIEEHAARLRPMELYPKRGSLEIWVAPGDSEMDVAYNRPHIQFKKMKRSDEVDGAANVRNLEIGFQGEIYESGEEGFRTWRTEDGLPVRDEIKEPQQGVGAEKGEKRPPTDEEMAKISEMLKGKDLNDLFDD